MLERTAILRAPAEISDRTIYVHTLSHGFWMSTLHLLHEPPHVPLETWYPDLYLCASFLLFFFSFLLYSLRFVVLTAWWEDDSPAWMRSSRSWRKYCVVFHFGGSPYATPLSRRLRLNLHPYNAKCRIRCGQYWSHGRSHDDGGATSVELGGRVRS